MILRFLFYFHIYFSTLKFTISCYDIPEGAKFTTFNLEEGNSNQSCAKRFFNSSDENDCRIFYIDKISNYSVGDFFNIHKKIEESEELNVDVDLFIRRFINFKSFTRVGLNFSIPILSKDTRGYGTKLSVIEPKSFYSRREVIIIYVNLSTPQHNNVMWIDEYRFHKKDEKKRNFILQVTEFPSGKQQISEGPVPDIKVLENIIKQISWQPVIFTQKFINKIVVRFSSAPPSFMVNYYEVELLIENKTVEQNRIEHQNNSFVKVCFSNLLSDTNYEIYVRGDCFKCKPNKLCFKTVAQEYSSASTAVTGIVLSLIFISIILMYLVLSRMKIRPEVLRKVLILQSCNFGPYSDCTIALGKALAASHFIVFMDEYRDLQAVHNVLNWLPDAVVQSDFVLIIWSKDAINEDKNKTEQPGNTVAANWEYALTQVKYKLKLDHFKVANVFFDENIKCNDINTVFTGCECIYLIKDWKKLISFLYSKDYSLLKRRFCKLYNQDLHSSSFNEGKELLKQYNKLKTQVIDAIPYSSSSSKRQSTQNQDGDNLNSSFTSHDQELLNIQQELIEVASTSYETRF